MEASEKAENKSREGANEAGLGALFFIFASDSDNLIRILYKHTQTVKRGVYRAYCEEKGSWEDSPKALDRMYAASFFNFKRKPKMEPYETGESVRVVR